MSACDTCPSPGACCHNLHLRSADSAAKHSSVSFWADEPMLVAAVRMAEMGLPFIPIEEATRQTDPATGREYVTYRYDCPLLGADGRCTEYDTRPDMCRSYAPKQDPLCVLHEATP